jgi:hypothetical protein
MESAASEKQNVLRSQMHKLNILLAVSVTVVVGAAIVGHWGTYDWFRRFVGVVLLLSLLVIGPQVLRKKEKIDPNESVFVAYLWLMLATILFEH